MKPCKECAVHKDFSLCPYDYKHSKLKSTPSKTREKAIKKGYEDCFWTAKDLKEYNTAMKEILERRKALKESLER